MVVQRRVGEGKDRLRHVLTRGLDGNVVVLLEVDTGVLLGRIILGTEELALNARVGRARHMFSILPATIPRASSLSSSTTTSTVRTGTGIRVGVEGVRASPEPVVARRGAVPLGTVVVGVVAVDESVSVITRVSPSWQAPDGSGRKVGECLLCPGTAVEAGHGSRAGGWTARTTRTVHGPRSRTLATSHMRRDVRSLGRRVLLLGGGAEGEPSHVELISHDCSRDWVC